MDLKSKAEDFRTDQAVDWKESGESIAYPHSHLSFHSYRKEFVEEGNATLECYSRSSVETLSTATSLLLELRAFPRNRLRECCMVRRNEESACWTALRRVRRRSRLDVVPLPANARAIFGKTGSGFRGPGAFACLSGNIGEASLEGPESGPANSQSSSRSSTPRLSAQLDWQSAQIGVVSSSVSSAFSRKSSRASSFNVGCAANFIEEGSGWFASSLAYICSSLYCHDIRLDCMGNVFLVIPAAVDRLDQRQLVMSSELPADPKISKPCSGQGGNESRVMLQSISLFVR